eukprot:1157021-Pelagomonas_calceolata.AAC.1
MKSMDNQSTDKKIRHSLHADDVLAPLPSATEWMPPPSLPHGLKLSNMSLYGREGLADAADYSLAIEVCGTVWRTAEEHCDDAIHVPTQPCCCNLKYARKTWQIEKHFCDLESDPHPAHSGNVVLLKQILDSASA